MTIDEARKRVITLRLAGFSIVAVFFALLIVSLMKTWYEHAQIDVIRYWIKTLYMADSLKFVVDIIWPILPVLGRNIFSAPSIWYVVLIAGIWTGRAVWDRGRETAKEIQEVEEVIRKKQMEESLRPGAERSDLEIRLLVERARPIQVPSLWRSFCKTILAPIIAGLIIAAIVFQLGWN